VITLSTTNTTQTRWQATDSLSKRDKSLVTAHWDEMVRYLPPPPAVWTWAESRLHAGLKHKLMHRGLISRSETMDDCWETTDRLWMYVVERAEGGSVGREATGQLPLDLYADIPDFESRDSRLETNRSRARRVRFQLTLAGVSVPVEDLEDDLDPRFTTDRWRDPTKPSARELAAVHPGSVVAQHVGIPEVSGLSIPHPGKLESELPPRISCTVSLLTALLKFLKRDINCVLNRGAGLV